MANRSTLHISHLPKLKMWLIDQGWEIQPLTDHGYEVLRAKRDKRTLVIYKKLDAKEHLSYADRDHRLIRRFFDYMNGYERGRSDEIDRHHVCR